MSERRAHRCDELPDDTHVCCSSCHEDYDAGYTELQEIEKDGETWVVCCNKANLLEGRPSTR